MMAGFRGNQIRGDAHLLGMLRHGSLHEIADPQRGADLARIRIPAPETNGGMAAQHVEPPVARQQTDHVLGEAVAEIIGVRLVAQVGERQHRDGWLAPHRSWPAVHISCRVRCLARAPPLPLPQPCR